MTEPEAHSVELVAIGLSTRTEATEHDRGDVEQAAPLLRAS